MQNLRILKADSISTGKRLRELIDAAFPSQNTFLDAFAIWKDDHPKYSKIKTPSAKDLSRWLNDTVRMRPNRIHMFADYFSVDFEYLDCTQLEPKKKKGRGKQTILTSVERWDKEIDTDALVKELMEVEGDLTLIEFLKSMSYLIEFSPRSSEPSSSSSVEQLLINKTIYTIEHTVDTPEAWAITLTYPNGTVQEVTNSELDSLLTGIRKYINFSMESIRKE